ncbi:MAG: DUF1343 domain-containing protein [Chlorobi bacterium]|nr:DUF1343 domain-containing protein [Chlorobiota bacterium]
MHRILAIIIFVSLFACSSKKQENIVSKEQIKDTTIKVAAERSELYLPLLKDKKVALVVNQTSTVKNKHLVDFLLENNINVIKIFAPEHGFRGNIDRGEHFSNNVDKKTGLPIIAMYGKNRKPKAEQLKDIGIIIFDIQDVGVRFYTYISSMHYVMEACAENNKKLIILDRPNPLGDYVDGPVLQAKFKSFVGMHQIPVVHGLTVGELAIMINEEGWLKNSIKCDLEIIKIKNYNHSKHWSLPIKPSPNLPNDVAIRLYPSLCFFEATNISIGRGTKFPFQVIGYPDKKFGNFTFTPKDIPGMQINPLHENKICYGINLQNTNPDTTFFTLKYIIDFASKYNNKNEFISKRNWFNLLAGNDILAKQIISGMNEKEIRQTWKNDLDKYKLLRKKYLLYTDFE